VAHLIPAPPWRTPRKAAPAQRPALSAELVLSTAMRIVDTEGLDALSMRRVAQELGTGAASLYAYVSSKDELLEQLLDRVAAEVPLPAIDPARWAEQLKQLQYDGRAAFLRHRDLARAAQATIPMLPHSLRLTEVALGLMRAGGVPDRYAAWAVDKLALLVVADVVEAAVHQAKGNATEADNQTYLAQMRDYLGSLPIDQFPNIVAMSSALFEGSGDERFQWGIDLIVDGIAALGRPA
jgi:AcrR family transcriptional regulator